MLEKIFHFPKKKINKKFDDSKDLHLSRDKILAFLEKIRYERPFILIDENIIVKKYSRFINALPNIRPFYALKANSDKKIINILKSLKSGFEIASVKELDLLLDQNVSIKDIHYSNPIKSVEYIKYATDNGLEYFAFDCKEEMLKVFSLNNKAKLILRIDVPNTGSDWPLSDKFGAKKSDLKEILELFQNLYDKDYIYFHLHNF